FKINEDVVIPLDKLAEYTEGVETINIRQSIKNKLRLAREIRDYLKTDLPELKGGEVALGRADLKSTSEGTAIITTKQEAAIELLNRVEARWQTILDNLHGDAVEFDHLLDDKARADRRPGDTLLQLLLRRSLRISWKAEIQRPIRDLFEGQDLEPVRKRIDEIHKQVLSSRLFVALHMHAGDGNVHTNIPVNSNDYEMMQEAERIVDEVMALARSLDGVISGEHGIGLTKIQ